MKNHNLKLNGLIVLGLIVMTLAVFWPVGRYEFVNFDDDIFVYDNPHLQDGLSWNGIQWALTAGLIEDSPNADFWIPLTYLSHLATYQFFGLDPGRHHWVNLVLHLMNTVLLFLLLRRMTSAPWPSAFVAALFAIHPLHLESVAWVTERKDVLSALLWFLTVWAYVRYTERRGWGRYGLVAGLLVLGLMSKPMVVTLPFVLLLLDYWPLGRVKLDEMEPLLPLRTIRGLVLEKLPLLAISAGFGWLTYLLQHKEGAVASLESVSIGSRIGNALVSYLAYMGKMAWPDNLAVFYPHPGTALAIGPAVGSGLFLACITLGVFWLTRRCPYLTVGWLWYLGTLIPVIGLLQSGMQSMADRYTYLPLVGLFIMIAWGAPDLLTGLRRRHMLLGVSAVAIVIALMVSARRELPNWRNGATLFKHAVQVTTDNYLAHYNLGNALTRDGKLDEAIFHYQEALKIGPATFARRTYVVHNSMGSVLADQGKLSEAIDHYAEALRLSPNYAKAHNNWGLALEKQGKPEEAVRHYAEALRISPDFAEPHNNWGLVLDQQGRQDEAILHYQEALRIKPKYAQPHNNWGLALEKQGKPEEAVRHYAEALRISPDDAEAHNNWGSVLVKQKKFDEGMTHFLAAIRSKPGLVHPYYNLGWVLEGRGEYRKAEDYFSEAVRIRPEFGDAHYSLGWVLAKQGRNQEAMSHFSEAVRINPNDPEAVNGLGEVFHRLGRYDEAVRAFETALAIDSRFPGARENLRAASIARAGAKKK
ncbi:MAG: tetratricopeptide repeat protein [Nitrospirae bacterium]|nr:tetratricopeptide repeat protein [Nitrospirota bacterium]